MTLEFNFEILVKNQVETRIVGCFLAAYALVKFRSLRSQSVAICLAGNIGAGKTTLARSIIEVLYCDPQSNIVSPTFNIVCSYPNKYNYKTLLYNLKSSSNLLSKMKLKVEARSLVADAPLSIIDILEYAKSVVSFEERGEELRHSGLTFNQNNDTDLISSPDSTGNLQNIHHFDFYRINNICELEEFDWQYYTQNSLIISEWTEVALGVLKRHASILDVRIDYITPSDIIMQNAQCATLNVDHLNSLNMNSEERISTENYDNMRKISISTRIF